MALFRINYRNNLKNINRYVRNFSEGAAPKPSRMQALPPVGVGCPPQEHAKPCKPNRMKGLVLGVYTNPDDLFDPGKLTPTGERYNSMVCGRLYELIQYGGSPPKKTETRVYFNLDEEFSAVALVGIGRECQGYDVFEQMDEGVSLMDIEKYENPVKEQIVPLLDLQQ